MEAGADQIAVGCPFCRVMLSDGLTSQQADGKARAEVEVLAAGIDDRLQREEHLRACLQEVRHDLGSERLDDRDREAHGAPRHRARPGVRPLRRRLGRPSRAQCWDQA